MREVVLLIGLSVVLAAARGEEITWKRAGLNGGASGHLVHGEFLYTASARSSYGAVQVWDLGERRFVKTLHSDYGGPPVALSTDGRTLITRGVGAFEIWNLTDESFQRAPTGPSYQDQFLGFQTQSNRLVILSRDSVLYWDVASESYLEPTVRISVGRTSPRAIPSQDGERAGVFANGELRIYSLSTLEYEVLAPAERPGKALFSPDGRKLAVATYWYPDQPTDQFVYIYNVDDRQLEHTLAVPPGEITGMAFAPDRPVLATYNTSGVLTLWDLQTGEAAKTFHVPRDASQQPVAFSGDGSTLICGGNFIDQETGESERFVDIFYSIDNLVFNADGSLLVTQSANVAHLWDARSGEVLAALEAPNVAAAPESAAVRQSAGESFSYSSIMRAHRPIHFTPDGKQVIVRESIFNIEDGEFHSFLETGSFYGPAAFADDWFYTSDSVSADAAELRSYSDGTVIKRLTDSRSGGSRAIATSSSGTIIGTVGGFFHGNSPRDLYVLADPAIKIWNAATGQLLTTLSNKQNPAFRLVFSENEKLIASGSELYNPDVTVWDVANGRQLLALRDKVSPAVGVDFLPDSRTLAYGIMNRLEFWDAPTRYRAAVITNEASFITAVAASPDGSIVVAGRMDGSVIAYKSPTFDRLMVKTASPSGLSLSFEGRTDVAYTIEASEDLFHWESLTNYTGTGGEIELLIQPSRTTFYRLK